MKQETKKCNFIPYGEVENKCTACGYITWVDKNKKIDEIISDMIKSGYQTPDCDNYNNIKPTLKQ